MIGAETMTESICGCILGVAFLVFMAVIILKS
jgi:hypothetical protein